MRVLTQGRSCQSTTYILFGLTIYESQDTLKIYSSAFFNIEISV